MTLAEMIERAQELACKREYYLTIVEVSKEELLEIEIELAQMGFY